ncbi:MAG TPA: hypothetical protein VGX23_35280 [Actinocrinis sp.]|nr:hypothetical protein [Actinocrinis sp.]
MTELTGPPDPDREPTRVTALPSAEVGPEAEIDPEATRIRPLPTPAVEPESGSDTVLLRVHKPVAEPSSLPAADADSEVEVDPEATRIRPLPTSTAAPESGSDTVRLPLPEPQPASASTAEPTSDADPEVDPEATRIRPLPRLAVPAPDPDPDQAPTRVSALAPASAPDRAPEPDPDQEPTRVSALPPAADPDQQATRVSPLPAAPDSASAPTSVSEWAASPSPSPAPTLTFATPPSAPAPDSPVHSPTDSLAASAADSPAASPTDPPIGESAQPAATKLFGVASAEPATAVQPLGPPLPDPGQAAAFPGSAPAPKPRRKYAIPTPALYSLLLVVGLVAGVGAGWEVQHGRRPTPLAPLSVAQPKYPQGPLFVGQPPVLLPAAQDDGSIAMGDLTTVLLPTPSGATAIPDDDHIWETLADEADNCVDQSSCLSNALTDGVDRIADTAWTLADGDLAEITITEYFPGSSGQAYSDFNQDKDGGDDSTALPAPTDSGAEGYTYTNSGNSGSTDYMVALHGNLLVEFLVWSQNAPAPDPSYIDGLVTQQLARL